MGDLTIGGESPIVVQSMTTTNPLDLPGTIAEIQRLSEAGCSLVRVTVPSVAAAAALGPLKQEMLARGISLPLVADVHFNPKAALEAAPHVEKVRINPGNFASGPEEAKARLKPLLSILKARDAALRIGVNHGSLSGYMVDQFGNGADGMVESAMEYLRLCLELGFEEIIVSLKASNPVVMINANRQLCHAMDQSGFTYPIHLGVTEAGEGQAGVLRSAAGIGALLLDGIGDTIRVSLTGDPVSELAPCRQILQATETLLGANRLDSTGMASSAPGKAKEAGSADWQGLLVGGSRPPRVELAIDISDEPIDTSAAEGTQSARGDLVSHFIAATARPEMAAESILIRPASSAGSETLDRLQEGLANLRTHLKSANQRVPIWLDIPPLGVAESSDPTAGITDLDKWLDPLSLVDGICLPLPPSDHTNRISLSGQWLRRLKDLNPNLLVRWLMSGTDKPSYLSSLAEQLYRQTIDFGFAPPCFDLYQVPMFESARVLDLAADHRPHRHLIALRLPADPWLAAVDAGSLLLDKRADLLVVNETLSSGGAGAPPSASPIVDGVNLDSAYALLQATGRRITGTEFISCPGCGRLEYDLAGTVRHVKKKFGHLRGVKIAIMGCVVNGPGEMADADYGYVGSGKNKVDLYVHGRRYAHGLSLSEADQLLIKLLSKT